MAKYETRFTGDFDDFTGWLHDQISKSSVSTSFEDGSDLSLGQVRVAVRVYERYSMAGGNRVSLNITVVGQGNDIYLTAISSGGSQAVFFKLNTVGEEFFMDVVINNVENYIAEKR